MWAVGCMAYELVAAQELFCPEVVRDLNSDDKKIADAAEDALFAAIQQGCPADAFEGEPWDPDFSPLAADFVRALVCVDPVQRLDAAEALAHPWLAPIVATKEGAQARSLKKKGPRAHAESRHGSHYCELMAGMASLEAQQAGASVEGKAGDSEGAW